MPARRLGVLAASAVAVGLLAWALWTALVPNSPSRTRSPNASVQLLIPAGADGLTICGPGVAPDAPVTGEPCRSVNSDDAVMRLVAEIARSGAATVDAACRTRGPIYTMSIFDGSRAGLKIPAYEALAGCGAIGRIGSGDYFRLSAEAERLLDAMAAGQL